jgi:hydroxyproline O-arabinosyltransferase
MCSYILMAEPDHIIVKPIPNLSRDGQAAAFPFFYIEPKKYENVLRKFFPEDKGSITKIDPIGNSPVIIEKVSCFLQYTQSIYLKLQK